MRHILPSRIHEFDGRFADCDVDTIVQKRVQEIILQRLRAHSEINKGQQGVGGTMAQKVREGSEKAQDAR